MSAVCAAECGGEVGGQRAGVGWGMWGGGVRGGGLAMTDTQRLRQAGGEYGRLEIDLIEKELNPLFY